MAFKQGFTKIALVGPALDLANLGIPSLVGYHIGKAQGTAEGKEEVNKPSTLGKLLKGALIPGYIGYRVGKGRGHEIAKKKKEERK